jgi:hypothetical protein
LLLLPSAAEVRKAKAELQALYDASLQGDIGLKSEGFFEQPVAQGGPWPRSTQKQLLILQADRQGGDFQNQQIELRFNRGGGASQGRVVGLWKMYVRKSEKAKHMITNANRVNSAVLFLSSETRTVSGPRGDVAAVRLDL